MGLSTHAEHAAVSSVSLATDGEPLDLEHLLASLPPWGSFKEREFQNPPSRGQAGVRLREELRTDIPEELLREMARETLGAMRCSQQYLDALRVVLGNQAHAERHGYRLEMNVRVTFTTERTMRTILEQMAAAGLTFGKQVSLGQGRAQVVHCFHRRPARAPAAEALEALYRRAEQEPHDRPGAVSPISSLDSVSEEKVPY